MLGGAVAKFLISFITLGLVLGLGGCYSDPQVQTGYGTLSGTQDGKVKRFLGIPYAKPPVGELRWANPQPPEPWEGVFEAHVKGHACTQYGTGIPVFSPDEDCLTLNIWVPKSEGPHPVMFWVHGGAQMAGSSNELQYAGGPLAHAQDVIVVSANYRLLVSGFYALPEGPNHPALTGNQAIKDLIAALEWVNSEIHHFGGDPNNITVFGESAGSTNTCALLATPKTRNPDLFQRVIMQSGACDTLGVMSLEAAQQEGERFMGLIGCDSAPNPLACARDLPIDALREPVKTDMWQAFGWRADEWLFQMGLVVDGDVFPQDPLWLLENDPRPNTPILLGTNADEGSLFAGFVGHPDDAQGYEAFLHDRYPEAADLLLEQYPFEDYPNAGYAHADIRGDMIMKCPTLNMAQLYSQHNATWMYSLTHVPFSPVFEVISLLFKENPPALGAFHTADIGFLFDFPFITTFTRPSDRQVRAFMQQAWGNFARTGNPNGEGLPHWQVFDSNQNNYLDINAQPSNQSNFRNGACDFWFKLGYGF